MRGSNPYRTDVDVVCLQTWFDLDETRLIALISKIKATWPDGKLVYLDWFAPLDLRYAEALNPHIGAYVKKQTFRELGQYGVETIGDTNLTDYYCRRYGLNLPTTRFSMPIGFQEKLVLGSGFEYSPTIKRLVQRPPGMDRRKIDLHARVVARGAEWYARMRSEASEKAASLAGRFEIAHSGRISYSRYIDELRSSKLCFSPFGYGEICWRDFEAMSTGALLLKPDVSHLRTANELFKPYETYVPLRWDFEDLDEKVAYYAKNDAERTKIARHAYDLVAGIYQPQKFLNGTRPLLGLLGIANLA